eukprot:11804242-Alexandrium_andersonii.AAC.1
MCIFATGIWSTRQRTADNTKCFGILPITCPRYFKQKPMSFPSSFAAPGQMWTPPQRLTGTP